MGAAFARWREAERAIFAVEGHHEASTSKDPPPPLHRRQRAIMKAVFRRQSGRRLMSR